MSWLDDASSNFSSLSDYWNASLKTGDGTAYSTDKTTETVPMNAVQSMQPVTAQVTDPGWSKFLQDTLGGVVGYAIRKDAVQNGVAPAATQTQPGQTAQAAARPASSLLMPALLVVGVVVAGAVVYKLVK